MHLSRLASEDSQALGTAANRGSMVLYRLSAFESLDSTQALLPPRPLTTHQRDSYASTSGDSVISYSSDSKYPTGTIMTQRGALVPYAYDPLMDDEKNTEDDLLHDAAAPDAKGSFPWRGIVNMSAIGLLIAAILMLFLGYPVITYGRDHPFSGLFDSSANTATGVVDGLYPVSSPFPMMTLIDEKTPDESKTITGTDGKEYELVFSDEFEQDGRSFYPGDDPYWEAVDLWYGSTHDLEWYDPKQITTTGGALQITMRNDLNEHGLTYTSGMLQSWNNFCFTTGYIEVAITFPGPNSEAHGYWPGAWTMGNLGRPGYGATTDGTWPYTYNSCDVGTFPNQTWVNGTGPTAATHSDASKIDYNFELSWLSGQRLSACTCDGGEHPGPSNSVGRGAPEIDILEQEHNKTTDALGGVISQSIQLAPFSQDYIYANDTQDAFLIVDPSVTQANNYRGSAVQQAISQLTHVPDDNFQGSGNVFHKYGFEYYSDPKDASQGYVSWTRDSQMTGRVGASAFGPDPLPDGTGVDQRLVSVEPMAIILNMGLATNWQKIELETMIFPATMLVDYVRVYQRKGASSDNVNIGCDPPNFPTMKYIEDHMTAYTNANLSLWAGDASVGGAGYTKPKNSMYDGC
ncbi:glycoside hydrolase family 16 protein [Peniophora sp. CONT]|nr:glycoside hydrolase family 16 protein [Peniophora sp. CONT]